MRWLVTGGAGFIGSNFVEHLLTGDDSVEVHTLDALTEPGSKANLAAVADNPHHHIHEGRIEDFELVADLLESVDVVCHFAAETHVDKSIENATPFVETNVVGTRTLLDAALEADVERFVQISTDEVYGEVQTGECEETAPLNPQNPYAATKASADLLGQSYYETHGVPVVIARPCNNLGPHQHRDKLIPKFITRAITGETLPIYGDGAHVREWIYVEDTIRAIERIARTGEPGEIYNIGSGDRRTTLDVTETIIEAVDASRDQIRFVDDRPGHDRRYAIDSGKMEGFGWEPTWQFEDAIAETVAYYTRDRSDFIAEP